MKNEEMELNQFEAANCLESILNLKNEIAKLEGLLEIEKRKKSLYVWLVVVLGIIVFSYLNCKRVGYGDVSVSVEGT